jgi:hypothetical protein
MSRVGIATFATTRLEDSTATGGWMKAAERHHHEAAGDSIAPGDRSDTWTISRARRPDENDEAEGACDLPLELRERVGRVHARLDCMEDCEVLDVAPDADWETLTRAYTALINDLHPGRYAGRALGAYGVKMETVVARATAAYHAIVKQRIQASVSSMPPPPNSETARARREAQERVTSRPESAARIRTATPARVSSLPPPGQSLPPPSIPPASASATGTKLTRSPQDEAADAYLLRARIEECGFDWANAAINYERAYELRPDAMTAARAARALHRADGDLHKAANFAQQAVMKEPRSADFHVVLAMIYREAGLLLRAASECERALECDARHERARTLLAKVRSRL